MAHAIVIGASRGIGLGLVARLLEQGFTVSATHRDDDTALRALAATSERLTLIRFDLGRPEQLADLAAGLAADPIDRLIINGAVLGPSHQRADQAHRAETADLFDINAMAPIRCARHLLERITPGTGLVVFISSVMGSVAENTRGDYELYRASKAALNSLTRSFACKDALPRDIGVLNLHPGWVATDLGGHDAPVSVEQSSAGLVDVMTDHVGDITHRFLDFEGRPHAW